MEHHVYFAVSGFDHDPAQLDLLIGRSADDYWRQGETYSPSHPDARRRENRWILSSNLDRDASHRDHFERLLYKLRPLADRLPLLRAQQYRFGIGVSQYFSLGDADFYLPSALIEDYRSLELTISFDQLGLSESGLNESRST